MVFARRVSVKCKSACQASERKKNGREYKYPLGAYEIYGWKKYRSVQHDDDDDDAAADDDGGDLDQLGNSSEDERKEEKRKLQLPSVCARTINV